MDGDEAIAIVGIGCKFPGANNVDEYWELLVKGECHVKDIPKERFNVDTIYDENPSAPGKTYVRKAGLIDNPFHWDHHLFGVSENEAAAMDPQQRYVLDCVHMAMEDGGITKTELDGTATSVYIGAMNADYQTSTTDEENLLTNYSVTGDSNSIMSARVSYHYNLLGPSMTIDTACSSALVAIHLGSESIKSGESTMAICGGVSSILYPKVFITLSRARMASPTGLSQAFSANADGYARGEGCGIVILETLGEAIRKRHKIWGTIQTGCNQDGQTTRPITAPSGLQQMKLMEHIYLKHGIDPSLIQYIEAHGTGTPVGDPIEVNSLGEFFMPYNVKTAIHKQNRLIGSVKTNIGHLESAAGSAGLIKILLMMKNEKVVPSLHAEKLNTRIDFEGFKFEVAKQIYPWYLHEDTFRMACVNCFGFGGTNSHAVVKQNIQTWSPNRIKIIPSEHVLVPMILTFSAQTKDSLVKMLEYLKGRDLLTRFNLKDISYSSTLRRDHWRYRVAFSVRSEKEVTSKLFDAHEKLKLNETKHMNKKKICYVFCGVGTAWTGMCQELLSNPVFEKAIAEIDVHLRDLSGWSIMDKLAKKEEMKDPMLCHIAIFACQVGLAAVWMSWGIIPDAVVGQSVGEVAAAFVSGYLSLKDAVKVIYFRSLFLSNAEGGRMMVIRNCKVETVQMVCQSLDHGQINIAVHSSSVACTVSGDAEAMDELKYGLEQLTTNNKPIFINLDVKCAYHSHHVNKYAEKLVLSLNDIKTRNPKFDVYSTVTGRLAAKGNFATAKYWGENVRSDVKFSQAIKTFADEKCLNIFIEIGPKPVLRSHMDDIFPEKMTMTQPSMQPSDEINTLYQSLAALYEAGVDPTWKNVVPEDGKLVDLPFYQFETSELKVESSYTRLKCQGLQKQNINHSLLTRTSNSSETFRVTVNPENTSFVYNHIIDGVIVLPGAFYSEIGLELGVLLFSCKAYRLDVSYDILHFVTVLEGVACELEIFSKQSVQPNELRFSVKHKDKITATGQITLRDVSKCVTTYFSVENMRRKCSHAVRDEELYNQLEKLGYNYQAPVQVCCNTIFHSSDFVTTIALTDQIKNGKDKYKFHPAVIDGLMHPLLFVFFRNCNKPESTKIFPVRIGSLTLRAELENRMLCYARNVQVKGNKIITNFLLTHENGNVIAELREVEQKIVDNSVSWHSIVHEMNWTPIEAKVMNEQRVLETAHLLIVSMQQHASDKLNGMFPKAVYLTLNYNVDVDDSWIEIKNILAKSLEKETYDGIIFITGKDKVLMDNHLYDTVRSSCHIALAILQVLIQDMPLFILTECTQHLPGFELNCPNLIGAELWGYAKSARLESEFQIFTIDMQPDIETNIHLLRTLIGKLLLGQLFHTDFIVRPDKIFGFSFIQNKDIKGIQHDIRVSEMDMKCPTELRSKRHDKLEQPFLLPLQSNSDETGILIQVHAVTNIQISALDDDENSHIWSEYKETGFPVIANELSGAQIFPGKPVHNKEKLVAACFPVRCTSNVVIPHECVCNLDRIPFYKPGILTSFIYAWFLSKEIKSKNRVCIIGNVDDPSPETIILSEMLQQKKVEVTITCAEKIIDGKQTVGSSVVIMTDYLLHNIVRQLCVAEKVVGFKDVITDKIKKTLLVEKKDICVKLINKSDIFEPKILKSSFPIMRSFIEKNQNVVRKAVKHLVTNQISFLPQTDNDENCQRLKIHMKPKDIILKNASYIVVGGLTGLGWEVVKWLARMGAGQVITMSRRTPSEKMEERIKTTTRIHRMTITTLQCDICSMESLREALNKLQNQECLPVKGVYQGAGILKDGFLKTMTREKIDTVLLPKVCGTLNLHNATLPFSIDHFVLHSSIASVIGNPGQTSYSAANAFLDAFAHYRRSQNLPCQSINWGALEVGMVGDNASIKEQLKTMGHTPLDQTMIRMSLTDALLRDQTQAIYAFIDMSKSGITSQKRKFFHKSTKQVEMNTQMHSSSMFDRTEFSESTEDEKIEKLSSVICASAAKVLSLQLIDIENDQSLSELGIESQQATEFIQLVHEQSGCKIPIAYAISPEYKLHDLALFAASQITADHVKEQPKDDLTRSITPIENMYMDIVDKHSEASHSLDLILPNCFSEFDVWKNILLNMIVTVPELRTLFIRGRNHAVYGIEKIIVEPEDSRIDIQVNCNVNMGKRTKNNAYRFDVSSDPPLRLFLIPNGKATVVKMVFNPVLFDFEGALSLARKMLQMAYSWPHREKNLPKVKLSTTDNTQSMNRVFYNKTSSLVGFWESELSKVKDIVTLSAVVLKPLTSEVGNISIELPNTFGQRMKLLKKMPSKVICCLYGMLLSRITNVNIIPIVANVDIRQHFPEFRHQIFQGTNFMPVILEFPYGSTMKDCVNNALLKITDCEQASLYPYEMIRKLNGFQKKHFRHKFLSRSLHLPVFASSKKKHKVICSPDSLVIPDKMDISLTVTQFDENNKTEIQLSYDKACFHDRLAETFISDLKKLLCTFLENPNSLCHHYHPDSEVQKNRQTLKGDIMEAIMY